MAFRRNRPRERNLVDPAPDGGVAPVKLRPVIGAEEQLELGSKLEPFAIEVAGRDRFAACHFLHQALSHPAAILDFGCRDEPSPTQAGDVTWDTAAADLGQEGFSGGLPRIRPENVADGVQEGRFAVGA